MRLTRTVFIALTSAFILPACASTPSQPKNPNATNVEIMAPEPVTAEDAKTGNTG